MKFALIGNGFIGSKHIEAINHVGGELVALCDINPERGVENVPFFTDYKGAIQRADHVSIATPNDTHTEIILECARLGKKILSEKPMTFKLNEIPLLKGVPNLFGMFQLRHLPEVNVMRKLKAKEAVLKVEMKRSQTYHDTWKGDPHRTGGLLINIGCHYFDLLGHLFGYSAFTSWSQRGELKSEGGYESESGVSVTWFIELTEEKPEYERSLTIDGVKFDLVQKDNLHKKVYEDFVWGQGTTIHEEEKILNLIYGL